jgi:predicted transglutaminase-like cysteine proteinase
VSHRFIKGFAGICAVVCALVLAPEAANAANIEKASMSVMRQVSPPIGWVQFCRDYSEYCDVKDFSPVELVLNERNWKQLLAINTAVNAEIEPVTDMEHWGVPERWDIPSDGKGDCEAYALEKRRRLIEAGWPRQILLMTVVRDKSGDGHAVLTVKTDRGDLILDNQEAKVLLWAETGYKFIKRQSEESPNRWVGLGNIDTQLFTAR